MTLIAKNLGGDALTLKAPITTAADNIHRQFFIVFQTKKGLMFQVNPLQRIHMKNQALFSSKDTSKQDLAQEQDSSPDSALPITYKTLT